MNLQLDELLAQLGNPGKYQIFIFFLLCLNYFPLVFNHVIMAFFGSRVDHQCHLGAYYPSSGISADGQAEGNGSSEVDKVASYSLGKCDATYTLESGKNVTASCPREDSFVVYATGESNIVTEVRHINELPHTCTYVQILNHTF